MVIEVGSVEVARDPEARSGRRQQAASAGVEYFKKSLGHLRPADPMSTYRYTAQRQVRVPVESALLRVARCAQRVLRLVPAAGLTCVRVSLIIGRASSVCTPQPALRCGPRCRPNAVGRCLIRRVLKAHGPRT